MKAKFRIWLAEDEPRDADVVQTIQVASVTARMCKWVDCEELGDLPEDCCFLLVSTGRDMVFYIEQDKEVRVESI